MARISVSPASLGAGPALLLATNQSHAPESLELLARGGHALVTLAPIDPQGTRKSLVELAPGRYAIAIAPRDRTDAQRSRPVAIRPAHLDVGKARPSSDGQLLQP